jgi:hypothetical protein
MRTTFVASLILATSLTACGGGGKSSTPTAPIADTTPPDTTIDSKPPAATTANSATFTFSASEAGATLETSLDGAAFATATSPQTFTGLAGGSHTFSVRARDTAGNVDATPATFTWGVDLVPPSARIVFPAPASYTDATSIAVRGVANDAFGVASVTVNGVAATSTDGFQTWRATVPIALGHNSLSVSATDKVGNVASFATSANVTNRGPLNYAARGIAYDPLGDRIVEADDALNRIYAYRPTDGYSSVISPAPNGANGTYGISDIAIDTARNRLIVVDYYRDALIAVDLAAGTRTTLTPTSGTDNQTKFADRDYIALDTANNRAFVTNHNYGCVIGVDLATGARSIVTGNTVGTGFGLSAAGGIAYDDATVQIAVPGMPTPTTPRLFVAQGDRIVLVDLATGNRTDFVGFWPNAVGPNIVAVSALRLDAPRHRVFEYDDTQHTVFAVDLVSGDRTAIAGQVAGVGPSIDAVRGMTLDTAASRLFVETGGQLVSVDLMYGQRTVLASGRIGRGLTMNYPEGIAIEQTSGTAASVLVTDRGLRSLMRVDLATGLRTAVSDDSQSIGTGPRIFDAAEVVVDTRATSNGHSAFVILEAPESKLLSVDLTTGNRTQIADLNASGAPVRGIRGLRLDANRNRVLFTDSNYNSGNALYAVDLATGARTTLMDANRGAGPTLSIAANIALEPAINPTRAYVSDMGLGGIYTIDLTTGDRSLFIDPWPAIVSPGDNAPTGLFLDTRNSRLIGVRTGSVSNLYSAALPGKAQQILSGDDPATPTITGAGPLPFGCFGMDVTADGVAYAACAWTGSIMAIDLISGDRVIVAR